MKLVSISAAWLSGIFLGSIFYVPAPLIFIGLLPIPFLIIFKKYRNILLLISICTATLFGAAYYYSASTFSSGDISNLSNHGTIEIKGMVKSPPDIRDKTTQIELTIEESNVSGIWQNSQGFILIYVPHYPKYDYGDMLWCKGKLEQPAALDNFDYQSYLASRGILATMTYPEIKVLKSQGGIAPLRWVYSCREALSRSLSKALPEPQASLGQGIVLGIKSTIPDSLKTDLSITGTAHLLAISGINLSIIAGILVAVGVWFWGRRYFIYIWLSLGMIWLYALLTGMQAPVIRAAIMATLFLLAELLGRQKGVVPALAFSAAIMAGIDPQVLWSVSFQLSFLAMIGLILIAPPLQTWAHNAVSAFVREESAVFRLSMVATDSFCISLAALLAVWPLIAYYFHTISLISPLSTLLIAPSLPAIIVTGTITAVAGLFSATVAQVIGWSSWLCLSYMLGLVYVFANLPLVYLRTGQIRQDLVGSYYGIGTLVLFISVHLRKRKHLIILLATAIKTVFSKSADKFAVVPKKFIIVPLIVLVFMTCFTLATMPDSLLHVSILDVGEGDAILIQNGNQDILIDGGPSPQHICQRLSERMPFWDKNIELVILTHPHLDHLNGLIEVLQRYSVNQVLVSKLTSESTVFREWQNLLIAHNVKASTAVAGQQMNLTEKAVLEVLSPPDIPSNQKESDIDEYGVVLKLTLQDISFLFMADTDQKTEEKLINRGADLKSTFLKVAHHGSLTSTSENFLAAVKPQIACISVGTDNLYSLPNHEVLVRLQKTLGTAGRLYRTDLNGTIEFITDGETIRVKTEK
jgi:competence protein ComEC